MTYIIGKDSQQPVGPKELSQLIVPDNRTLVALDRDVRVVWGKVPETTCDSCGYCCKCGCPHMRVSEFAVLFESFLADNQSKAVRLHVYKGCMRNFLSNATEKPCPLLSEESKCLAYEHRPFNCRIYGMIDKKEYRKRVDKARKERGDEEEIPMEKQCRKVKLVDEKAQVLTSDESDSCMRRLCLIDKVAFSIGEGGYAGYRTLHDWVILRIFGEEKLSKLSEFRVKATEETLAAMQKTMCDAMEKML
jgi:Fe-S-cluster containining protein